MLTLMAALRVLLATLLSAAPVTTESGLAAVYGYPGDTLAGGPLACTGKMLTPTDHVCAHRTLPCGTVLLVQSLRSQRIATCQVLDRGPYGARLPGGRFVIKTHPRARGTWRGVVDLSPGVARSLRVHTSEPVRLIYMTSREQKILANYARLAGLEGLTEGLVEGLPVKGPVGGPVNGSNATKVPQRLHHTDRACAKGPCGPTVKRHAEPHLRQPRGKILVQPLVSSRSTGCSGNRGVFV